MNETPPPAPTEIPVEIQDAARKIEMFFEQHGQTTWELLGLCSRNHSEKIWAMRQLMEIPLDQRSHRLAPNLRENDELCEPPTKRREPRSGTEGAIGGSQQ